jgi:uncharacterized membrane protein
MAKLFGIVIYTLGLVMMITMILEAMDIIDRASEIATVAFLIFGYLLCVTGYLFARRSSRIVETHHVHD